jgi:Tol biopolymer transport system component
MMNFIRPSRTAIFISMAAMLTTGIAGCASFHKSTEQASAASVSTGKASVAPPLPVDDVQSYDSEGAAQPAAVAAPVNVNVFGELNGVPRGPGITVGDEGFQQHTFTDEGADSDVSVDPTGKWIVFASTRHNEHAGIYTQRVDGTAVTKLTSDDSDNAFPTFSPDGKQIAFCSTRSGTWNIYVMDIDGRNAITVTSGSTQCIHPSYSPDGTRLVYSALGARSNQWELWTVNIASGEKQQIGYGLFPSWSPNKEKDQIAFQRARQRGSRWFSLWTLDLVDGEARRVTEVAVSSNAAIVSPSWSPDGKRLVFATILDPAHGGKKIPGGPNRGEQDIWTIDLDGNNRRRITDGNGINLSPVWSSDNRVYFVSNRSGTESVWSVRPGSDREFTAAAPKVDKPRDAVTATDTRDADK